MILSIVLCFEFFSHLDAACWQDLEKLTVNMQSLVDFNGRVLKGLNHRLQVHPQNQDPSHETLVKAMNYALEGGKRTRALLMFAVAEALQIPADHLMPAAVAVECFQAASIVCDDLPQQDNADLRRGRLALHRQFSESTAQLAIIALIAYGYQQLPSLGSEYGGHYPDGKVLRLIDYVSQAIGMNGLTWGQVLDLDRNHPIRNFDQLKAATFLKTGLAFEASVYPAFILLGEPQSPRALAMKEFAREVGVIFQAQDDYLDATKSADQIGKSAGIDSRNGTKTYVTELGLDGVLNQIANSTFRALEHLRDAGLETDVLRSGVIGLARRPK